MHATTLNRLRAGLRSGLLALLCSLPLAGFAEDTPFREIDPLEDYPPQVEGDRLFSNSYQFWKDRATLDPMLAGNPDENWRLNWKFMDPPFNPIEHGGHFALARGEMLYGELNAGGQFATCLGARKGRLKGLRLAYPRYSNELGQIVGLEATIEQCAGKQGVVLENGSYDNSAVSLYITSFSNGLPMRTLVAKGPLKAAFERGRLLFHTRNGRYNFACSSCHTRNPGRHLRGSAITTAYGDAVHFPVYRPKHEIESLHVRMMNCQLDAGMQPLKPGNPVYHDLEVFLSALSNGYPVMTPVERP